MERNSSVENNQSSKKTRISIIEGDRRPKKTDTSLFLEQEHVRVVGKTGKFENLGSTYPLEGSQKNSKRLKGKKKARELSRYQRKILKNPEMEHLVVDDIPKTSQDTHKTDKGVNRDPCQQEHSGLMDKDSTLESQQTNVVNIHKFVSDSNMDKNKKQKIPQQAGDGCDENPSKNMQSDRLHGSHINDEDTVVGEHHIYRLNKKSPRFPNAKFYCRLCNYHLDNITLCKKHWKEPRHSTLEETKSQQRELKKIKAPSKLHCDALTALLKAVVDKTALKDSDVEIRQHIAQAVEKILHKTMPDVKVNVYGSSLSGFGFQDSDVNLSVEAAEGSVPSQVLVMACQALIPGDEIFEAVESDFEGRFPCIRFTDKNSGLRCELCTGSVSAIKTSKLLYDYRQIDPRVHLLAMALRHWARLCGVDSQSDGSMPAYSFVLMTIYFLQQCLPPVVPVLQENETLEETNTDSLGELWIKMLRFYTLDTAIEEIVISIRKRGPVSRDELKIPNRRLAIEDPIATNKKNIAKSLSSNIVFQYVFDRLQDALLYFGKPQKAASKSANELKPASKISQLQPHSNSIDAEDIPEFHAGPSDVLTGNSLKVTTTSRLLSNSSESGTESSIVGGEYPLHCSNTDSLTESVVTNNKECTGSVTSKLNVNTREDSSKSLPVSDSSSLQDSEIGVVGNSSIDIPQTDSCVEDNAVHIHHFEEALDCTTDVRQQKQPVSCEINKHKEILIIESDNNGEFSFVFDEKILTGGKKAMVVCNGCAKEGHKISECPDDSLPKLISLPAMDRGYLKRTDALCTNVAERFCLKDWEMKRRDKAVDNYEWFIRENGYQDARLQLFGSSRNGFGFSKSDMDICLKFQHHKTAEELDIPYIVEDLAKKLKRRNDLYNVIPISTAKVPIVKFVDRYMQLDADISLYNCLAQANTRMLLAYSKIDPRVRQLVYTAKVFAKVCDIGDASKGSLSSYAYTLMMIFFLQQRAPPVVPVLQELFSGSEKPEHIVEGCNAWYFSDLHKLQQLWRGSNKESVGELWLGFLRFFTEDFNNKKHVVCIRQHKPLTRFEKMWTGAARGFAIEDPFDLDHNLGGGVSRKMATFIMQVFINAREHFGLPQKIGRNMNDFDFFFDAYLLTGGENPPNDRCCRVCGKIGHFLKDCPHRKGNKDGNRDRDEMKKRKDRGKTDVKPLESVQQTDTRNNGSHGTMQDRVSTSRQSTQGTNRNTKPTMQVYNETKPDTGTQLAQTAPAKLHVGSMQQTTPAKPHAGSMQQTTPAKPHAGSMQQTTPAKPHAGSMQQTTPAKPHAGSVRQTTSQAIHTKSHNTTDLPQSKNIEDAWKQHQEDKKYQKKQDTRRKNKSESTNKRVARSNASKTIGEQSMNGSYDQAYPALHAVEQSQYIQPQQLGQKHLLPSRTEEELNVPDRPPFYSKQRMDQHPSVNERQQVHSQTYVSSHHSTAQITVKDKNVKAAHTVQQLDCQPLQQHQPNVGFKAMSDKQVQSVPQHWPHMQQNQQQQQVSQKIHSRQPQQIQCDQGDAGVFDLSKLAKCVPFHQQPLPLNEQPLQLHELEAMQMEQQKELHVHLQQEHSKQQQQQQQQQRNVLQPQHQDLFQQQNQHQEYQQQQNHQQYQAQQQQNEHHHHRQQQQNQQQQHQQHYQEQHQQYHQHQAQQQHKQQQLQQQDVTGIQFSQSMYSASPSLPMKRQGSSFDTYCQQSTPLGTHMTEGGGWGQGGVVPTYHVPAHPSTYWPSDQQSTYSNQHSQESKIGDALLHGVSVLQSETNNDELHMQSMHCMGRNAASTQPPLSQHKNQHDSILQ